ncbi:hypothetical protein [Dapis sp. BLCC M229]
MKRGQSMLGRAVEELGLACSCTLRFFTPKMASKLVLAREIPHSAKNS